MRVFFFGTPGFAVPSLERILEEGIEVGLVVTRPDRPVGRRSAPRPSSVGSFAAARNLPIVKPERVRENLELLRALKDSKPDAGVVVSYGKILPKEILELARLGCVNVHASILPRYRGASPIQAAILAGDSETGVVTMRMEEGLDTGPLYLSRRVPIGEKENAASLSERLSRVGADLLIETLRGLEAGRLEARPQAGEPSLCRPLSRKDGEVDWSLPAHRIERMLRALTPWPGLYTFLGKERVKILDADLGPKTDRPPGEVWSQEGSAFVSAGEGTSLLLRRLQRSGRQPVTGSEFVRSLPGGSARFSFPAKVARS